jgi:hypothetical protein
MVTISTCFQFVSYGCKFRYRMTSVNDLSYQARLMFQSYNFQFLSPLKNIFNIFFDGFPKLLFTLFPIVTPISDHNMNRVLKPQNSVQVDWTFKTRSSLNWKTRKYLNSQLEHLFFNSAALQLVDYSTELSVTYSFKNDNKHKQRTSSPTYMLWARVHLQHSWWLSNLGFDEEIFRGACSYCSPSTSRELYLWCFAQILQQ